MRALRALLLVPFALAPVAAGQKSAPIKTVSIEPPVAAGAAAPAARVAVAVSAPRKPFNERRASPEERLIHVYRLVGDGNYREALEVVGRLTQDVPNFRLAHLVHGDLLMARRAPLTSFGAGVAEFGGSTPEQLETLRREAALRLQALREQPPEGTIPRQFLELPPSTRHAIAVDASRARLYLFERGDEGLSLVSSRYVSLGRLGIGKQVEGDQRTPLGVYYITSRLDDRQVSDFYGPGALPLNYPNEYDRRLGRTGSGIWLHGVPRDSYVRAPLATDGCVALANDDLRELLQRVSPRTTPVVIAEQLEWVAPHQTEGERRAVLALLESWREAVSLADLARLSSFYSPQFARGSSGYDALRRQYAQQARQHGPRETQLKDVSVLSWRDESEVLVVTFGEVSQGERRGRTKRQYWGKEGGQWKIFYEGVI
jgi:murein L,D-transpeptidase YafK